MRGGIFFLSAAAVLPFLSACNGHVLKGEGAKTTEVVQVATFAAVDISVSVKAVISVVAGAAPHVELDGYANLLQHIKTKVENNKLVVTSDLEDDWNFASSDGTTLKITVPDLDGLSLSGATNADVHGILSGGEFKLDIAGAGKVVIDSINVDNFSTVVSGAGEIEVKGGAVHNANYQVSGIGKIKAFPLKTSETTTSISGEGKAELTAMQKLNVDINGAAKIKYKGHPTLTQEISGSGTISDAN